ncbi:unnamed protein product, partial [marine sediment metagenome]
MNMEMSEHGTFYTGLWLIIAQGWFLGYAFYPDGLEAK